MLRNMYNIIYNMPITYTNIMEGRKYEKDAFKHFFLVDLDFTWTLPGVLGCYLDFTWTPPGQVGECKVLDISLI
jgi:hypothetical protein